MLLRLIDASGWTAEQWLAATILVFIVITVIIVICRVIGIIQISAKSNYKPNLRPLRRDKSRLKLSREAER